MADAALDPRPAIGGIKPYFERDGIVIYHGDCREILPLIDPASVELVLTDPPYGVGFDYGTGYDDTEAGYIDFLWPIIEQAERTVTPAGHVVIWQSAKHMRHWGQWFPREWRPFALPKQFVQMRPTMVQWATDYALFWKLGDGPFSKRHQRNVRGWQVSPARDWHVSTRGTASSWDTPARDHPCPRPIDSTRYLIGCFCAPGCVILDPFLGSGTTLIAAAIEGRRAIGIEIEERFCALAAQRLEDPPLIAFERLSQAALESV